MRRAVGLLPPIPALALISALVAACGDRGGDRVDDQVAPGPPRAPLPRATTGTGFPIRVVTARDDAVVVPRPPQRIVLANANFVDLVTCLVPAERVVALPEQALTWTRLCEVDDGFRRKATFRRIDVERVVALQPDLVLCSPFNTALVDSGVRGLDVPVLMIREPYDLDELFAILALIGRVLGADDAAAALRSGLERRIAALRADPGRRRGLGAVTYSNYGGTGWTAGRDTMADQMIRLCGMHNLSAAGGKSGHARLTFEELVALDPDVIVFAERFGESSSGTEAVLRNEPALRGVRAVRHDRLVAIHPRFFSTNSQEVVTGAERLAETLDALLDRGAPERRRESGR